jgi:hypothetical protein
MSATPAPINWLEWLKACGPIVVALLGSGVWAWFNQRALERERAASGQALEALKAQLTFESEVRRQAAVRKVEALLTLDAETVTLLRVLLDLKKTTDDRLAAVFAWGRATVHAHALLTPEALAEITAFQGAFNRANQTLGLREMQLEMQPRPDNWVDGSQVLEAHAAIEGARNRLLQMIRRELQVVGAGDRSASR